MKFVIVGPGALGVVFGSAFVRASYSVSLLGRPSDNLEAMKRNGVELQALGGEVQLVEVAVTDDPAIVADADIIIVLVKTFDSVPAMRPIRSYVRPGTPVLTLQNGIGNARIIRDELGSGPVVLSGVTSQAAVRLKPNRVVHTGVGPTIIGFESELDAGVAIELAREFSLAGLPAASTPDIERAVWRKVAVNAAINGLTALGGFSNGAIVAVPDLLDVAESIGEEVAAVALGMGIDIGPVRRAIRETAHATSGNRSSMLQDIESGRLTEVDAIHGAILTEAGKVGVATPMIQVITALLRAKARKTGTMEICDDGR
jgi:2-dehydropantoate 2-reductase